VGDIGEGKTTKVTDYSNNLTFMEKLFLYFKNIYIAAKITFKSLHFKTIYIFKKST